MDNKHRKQIKNEKTETRKKNNNKTVHLGSS